MSAETIRAEALAAVAAKFQQRTPTPRPSVTLSERYAGFSGSALDATRSMRRARCATRIAQER
jgi:hypothetical protein